jgi:Zn-dependent protease with chaperone function
MAQYIPKLPQSNPNVSDRFPVFSFLKLVALCLLVLGLIYQLLGLATDAVVPQIDAAYEQELFSTYLKDYAELKDVPEYSQAVLPVLAKLEKNIPNCPYHFKVKVVDDPVVNAIAYPGGNVVVYKGLLDAVVREEELAFVLSHEIGHVVNRDHLKSMGRILLFMTTTSFFLGPDNSINKLLSKTIKVTELQFSKQQELNADQFALQLMNQSYHHVGPGIRFFERELVDPRTPNWVLSFLSTHPDTRERIEIMKRISKEKGYRF